MSDLIEQYREIVNNAPEGANATIIAEDHHYYLCFKGLKQPSEWLESHKSWVTCLSFADVDSIHWLDNLRTIIAQHDRIAELEREHDELVKTGNKLCVNLGYSEVSFSNAYISLWKRTIAKLRKGAGDVNS
jgi:hypothetical protein